jgi:hypothetical protein
MKAAARAIACVAIGFVGASLALSLSSRSRPRAPNAVSPTAYLTVEQFRDVCELSVVRLAVETVVEARVTGKSGGVSALVLVRGDVDLGVDLATAQLTDLDPVARTATLKLRAPASTRPRIDPAATRIVELRRSGLWSVVPGCVTTLAGSGPGPEAAVLATAMAEGEARIARAAAAPGARRQSRSRVEQLLAARARELGCAVRIVWTDG